MKRLLVFLALFAFAAAVPAGAQTQPNSVAMIIQVNIKPGEGQQWEAAYKRFHAWEHQHNYPYTYYTWSIVAGAHTGDYVVGTFDHNWSDFDKMDKLNTSIGVGKEIEATVAPYTESIERSFYVFQPDFSVTPPNPAQPPMPLSEVVFFSLKPGSMAAVTDVIKQVNAAIKKTNWPGAKSPGEWYELAEGEGAQLVLATGYQGWAGFQEPTPSLRAMLEQVYGKASAAALFHEFDEHLRDESSQVLRYRPSLSYIAAAQ